jgi:type I restriction enzyme S subunit
MSNQWPTENLGAVLRRSEVSISPAANTEYREITVRLWGKGVVERGRVPGASLPGRRFVARAGQFIVSRIDARNGAMGLVPESLNGALVTNDFPLFDLNENRLDPTFFEWLCRTPSFVALCQRASEGTTNRVRLKEERFMALDVSLPSLADQKRIVARIEEVSNRVRMVKSVRREEGVEIEQMLSGAFWRIAKSAPRHSMHDIVPLRRRPVVVVPESLYPELGIRSFGNGTFHKPALTGLELGSKRIFSIEPGDLLFSNVFAWEGAIAVATEEDNGRYGSHRFITCVPKPDLASAEFLCFYFLTYEGLELIGKASPGGAGRNRTLGISALERILVPVPNLEQQRSFTDLLAHVTKLKKLQEKTSSELDALFPSVLSKAFSGGL